MNYRKIKLTGKKPGSTKKVTVIRKSSTCTKCGNKK